MKNRTEGQRDCEHVMVLEQQTRNGTRMDERILNNDRHVLFANSSCLNVETSHAASAM